MTSQPKHPPGPGLRLAILTSVLSILAVTGAPEALSAPAPVSAIAKLNKKIGNVVITGKTAKNIPPNSMVSAYDASTQILLYSIKSDNKRAFTITLPTGTVPCMLRMEAGNTGANQSMVKVIGAEKSCKTALACSIASPKEDQKMGHGEVAFAAGKIKTKRGVTVTYNWDMGDGSALVEGEKPSHHFHAPGKYRVVMTATDSTGNQCTDDRVVSVAPGAADVPAGKVPEQPAPGTAAAKNAPDNSYVVLPFEETGMQGGSMIHLPYNPLIPFNALNAQVLKKVEHKPPLLGTADVNVFYSAASNPNDPVGGDSINSTSQNWFGNEAGVNFDPATSQTDPVKKLPTDNKFIAGHDYREAKIRKNELWDRIHQPYAKDIDKIPETGRSIADTQSTATPPYDLAKADESMRGYVDGGTGVRKMPGIANPYQANDPQKFDYSADQRAFVAQFIPASDIDDKGRTNPYPLMRVEAKDPASGAVLAKADAVYTTASETRCRECHTPGGIAANEDVWRTPVTEAELKDLTDPSKPGPATGAGSFLPGTDPSKPWPPAIHNRFDDKHPDNPAFTNLAPGVNNILTPAFIPRDANGLRTDRVKASQWVKLDPTTGKPTSETSPTKPQDATNWRLQVQLNFRAPEDVGSEPSWVEQEKAALFNTLVMHDYMVFYGPTPATGKDWPASYSTQVADSYADDVGKSRAQPMYFCAGHHYSQLKFDNGVASRSYPTNRSDYSRAFHAFHGKMQVYKADVTAGADGQPHKKGELIRDERGHPKMYGGRGWDSQHNDDNGVPLQKDANGNFTVPTVPTYADPSKNNWAPDLFPMDPNGELMLPFEKDGKKNVAMEENCVKCHTGKTEKSYRDIHHAAGLKCENCHSDMLAVGNVFPNNKFDANLTGGGAYTGETIHFRRPWLDEPDCGSCHVGDGNLGKDRKAGYFSAGAKKQAWADGDPAGASTFPINARFAVMPHKEERPEKVTVNGVTTYVNQPLSQALYRKSADVHGSGPTNGTLTCSTCHGGSHAIWPNPDPNANDNVTAKQLQGYDGNIAECSVCHTKEDFKDGLVATDGGEQNLGVAQGYRGNLVSATAGSSAVSPKTTTNGRAYLAGPHGMHPVGDPYWYEDAPGAGVNTKDGTTKGGWHNDMAKMPGPDGEDQCAACHGKDHKGTRLSKTLTDRVLKYKKKTIKLKAGQIVSCGTCHSLKQSFTGVPRGEARNHPPPTPEPIAGGGGGGGGHH